MVPQVIVPRALEALPARPPTPPRERTVDSVVDKQRQLLAPHPLDPRRSLHTPPNYSPDSSDLSDPTSRRTRKRVGFSSQTEYREPPTYVDNAASKQRTPISASSTISVSKPIKSILKPSNPVVPNPLDPCGGSDEASRHANIVTMLESTIKQLAGADRESKLDAYMMLVRALKASNNLPDRIALQDKMSLFMQFIQRDLTTKAANGGVDSSLSNHASTLLITFLNFPAISATLTNEFGVFIVDHCIRSFEDPSAPKDVIRHVMQIVASQSFSPKVMTADRVGRLVSALHRIEEHLKGKSIIMSRLLIYRRLIKQSKPHMVTHSDWLLDLFADMLSNVKEIRATAIALGLEASFSIGKEKQLSRRVMEILQLVSDETKYIEYYINRLKSMAKDKHESAAVPQIWSVIILLMRCPVDRWEFFGPWLEIIQLCFNSSDFPTKFEANYAWNRLVYCLQLSEQSFSKTIATVCQPFLSQLKRRAPSKQTEELRRVVIGSVCNLYYYVFRPNVSSSHMDSFWDSCVPQLIQKMANPDFDAKSSEQRATAAPREHVHQAIQILTGLLNSTTPRIWKEDHIADTPLVKSDELPALDPKWVRRNSAKVFAVVEPLLSKTFLDLSDNGSASARLWKTLVGTVAFAASKEVKVSTDTATFMAFAFTFLFRVWSSGPPESEDSKKTSDLFFEATRVFLSTIVDSLGLLPFTEKQLSMGKQNMFMPVATPSHRPGKGQGTTRTPLHHLFSILSSLPPGTIDDDGLTDLIRSVLTPFLTPKSPRAKADLCHELMQSLPNDTLAPYGPWVVVSEILCESLESSQASNTSTNSNGDIPVGHEYREVVKHLERGLKSTPNLSWPHWRILFQALSAKASDETGDAGCAIAIIEPLAKATLDIIDGSPKATVAMNVFRSGIELVTIAKQPRDRQVVDAARRRLWGTAVSGSRSASFDVYDNLYRLTNSLMDTTYYHLDDHEVRTITVPLLTEVAGFITRCAPPLVFKSVVNLQNSVGLWIQDPEERYNSRLSADLSEAVKLLWNRICNVLIETDSLEQVQLDSIEPLLCSAFESKHKHIVNTVASMWNRAFEHTEEITYPDRLKTVLLLVRAYVDIVLPGLDVSSYESNAQQPTFIESQEDSSEILMSSAKNTPPAMRLRSSKRSSTSGQSKLSASAKRRIEKTPESSRSKPSRSGGTPRLRHDNSQIQFAPIESSSPSLNALESQVLTERQKEVRQRQQDNAALFPQIRSSPEKSKAKLPRPSSPSTSKREKETTPKSHRSFEDYVSSTPTPRRGQPSLLEDNDHEMTDDFPSSPPEPRRYPLLPEISKTQSSSSSVLDEWQFLSSPLSGSPRQNRQMLSNDQRLSVAGRSQDIVDKIGSSELRHAVGPAGSNAVRDDDAEHADIEDEAQEIMPKAIVEDVLPAARGPATPPNARVLKIQETPRSDNEVFVDALTSPAPQTPRTLRSRSKAIQASADDNAKASQIKENSFEASEVDEQSLLRLVVEMGSRKCESTSRLSTESPEKQRDAPDAHVLDCIMVKTRSYGLRSKSRRARSGQSPSPSPPSTPTASSSQLSDKRSRKRKVRDLEKTTIEAPAKKHRQSLGPDADMDAPADSLLLQVNHENMVIANGESPAHLSQGPSPEDSAMEDALLPDAAAIAAALDDRAAVNLQISREASQCEESKVAASQHSGDPVEETSQIQEASDGIATVGSTGKHIEEETAATSAGLEGQGTAVVEKPSIEKIMEALRSGFNELRAAALSREEVYKVEDMFMDMKRELYAAEVRGRNQEA
ncbi:Rap1-interacting factor 1 N terminal-domain-containing protein [Xylariales sp. PMI_506]|nr:Rap1-interacting factor 1 N terminal-domain-containing protein [Xylariales sp. PMI_506]